MGTKQQADFSAARRGFLRGDIAESSAALLPPWSGDAARFYASCTSCGECIKACPEQIIIPSRSGYPSVSFKSGGCTFCGECVTHCEPQALQKTQGAAPWVLHAQISDKCLTRQHVVCRTCGERCEVDAIHFKPALGGISQPALSDALCTGCGFCVADCPTQAISVQLVLQAVAPPI